MRSVASGTTVPLKEGKVEVEIKRFVSTNHDNDNISLQSPPGRV